MGTTAMFNAMAAALGVITSAEWPDTVTFQRSGTTKSSAGGNIPGSPSTNSPSNVPVRYRPASGNEAITQGKVLAANSYLLYVPAQFSSALVDVDAKSTAIIAARSGGEPSRTFQIQSVGRYEGLEIELLATLES